MSRRSSRERGATYTLIILSMSIGLLVAGATLTGAARNTFRFAAEQGRQVQAREAAFAGVRWAAVAARATPSEPVRGSFRLAQAEVTVEASTRQEDGALLVTSTADLGDRALQVAAVLLPDGQRYRLETFEARRVD